MKKIDHESIESYKMLKFNTFSFFTPRKLFPIMLLMLLILFRFAMYCIILQGMQCVALVRQTSLYIFPLPLY